MTNNPLFDTVSLPYGGLTMTDALLLIDHGSKRQEANNQLFDMVSLLEKFIPNTIVVGAHMELCDPSIKHGVQTCIDRGATHIIACPYMLAPGRHSTSDIPRLVEDAVSKHTDISHTMTPCLGVDDTIAQLILKRARLDHLVTQ